MRLKNTLVATMTAIVLAISGCLGGTSFAWAEPQVDLDDPNVQYSEKIAEMDKIHGQPVATGWADGFQTSKWRQYADGFLYVYGGIVGFQFVPGWNKSNPADIYLEDGIAAIGSDAFDEMTIESIRVPDSLLRIGARTFEASKIKSITLPKVRWIEEFAFAGTQLGEITLSDELIELGFGAFRYSTLKEIVIPNQLTAMEYETFLGCKELQKVQLGTSLVWLGAQAFKDCTSLTEVVFGDSLQYINDGVFENCTMLQNAAIPDKVTVLGKRAFAESGIVNITMPDMLETIDEEAFYHCVSLPAVELPTGLKKLGQGAFRDCTALKTAVKLPDGVRFVEARTFSGCSSLEGVILSDYIVTIEEGAFAGCSSFTKLDIPKNVKTIASEAFYGTTAIQTINFSEGLTRIENSAFEECGATTIDVPESVELIGDRAFAKANAQEIQLPENLNQLGNAVFEDCKQLTQMVIPKNIKLIRCAMFRNCEKLESVKLLGDVTKIEVQAFYNCASLKNLQIPDSVQCMETKAFADCTSLPGFVFPKQIQQLGDDVFFNCESLKEITVPGVLKALEGQMFWGCKNLETVVFEEGMESVGSEVFQYCHSLNSVTIPSTMKSVPENILTHTPEYERDHHKTEFCIIGDGYLYEYTAFSSNDKVVIPDTVKTIGAEAFSNEKMKEVVIPDSVTTIESQAFDGCSRLETIRFGNNISDIARTAFEDTAFMKNKKLDNPMVIVDNILLDGTACTGEVVIPEGVTRIADEAFMPVETWHYPFVIKSEVTSVQIPDTVKVIGRKAFYDCNKLQTLHMGNGVETIENKAFSSCASLNDFQIGSGVKVIGMAAFSECGGMEVLHIPSNVRIIEDSAFFYTSFEKIIVDPGVTTIGDYAFFPNTNMQEFSLPDTITSLGESICEMRIASDQGYKVHLFTAGNVMTGLWGAKGDFVVPDGITTIGSRGFNTDPVSVTIPDSVTHIEDYAFRGCRSDLIVYAKEGSYAAQFAKERRMIYIPWDARLNAEERGEISRYGTCGEQMNWVLYRSGLLYLYGSGAMNDYGDKMPWDGEYVQHVMVQEGITGISANAFKDMEFLVGVDLAQSVTDIGEHALDGLRTDVCIYSYAGMTAAQIAAQNGYLFVDKASEEVFDGSVYGKVEKEGKCGENAYYRIHGETGVFIYGEGDMWDYENEYTSGGMIDKRLSCFVLGGKRYKPWGRRGEWPDDLRELGVDAVYIKQGITGVGENAFEGLNRLYLPESLKSIGDYAFVAVDVENLHLPKGLLRTGENCFRNCKAKEVIIPNTIVNYGGGEFVGSTIDRVVFEDGITYIRNSILGQCTLQEIVIPDSVTRIEDYAFWSSSFEAIKLPAGLKEIGDSAFEYAFELKKIEIPDSVEYIGSLAFQGCRYLESVKLPAGLLHIGKYALYDTPWLKNQTYTDGMVIVDNVLLSVQPSSGEFRVPDGIRVIANNAFADSDITGVIIPEGVVGIGENAFERCYQLEEIQFPSTIKDIDGRALDDTPWYEKKVQQDKMVVVNDILIGGALDKDSGTVLAIPQGVVRIADGAFQDEMRSYYKSIRIPSSVTYIGKNPFHRNEIENVIIEGNPVLMEGALRSKYIKKITGIEGSNVETYAKAAGIPYEALQDAKTGDLDNDNKVTLADAQIALKAALKIISLSERQKKAANVDKDDKVTLMDAQMILKVALRITNFEEN